MAKCAHCGGGKAKRPCPALSNNICSRCCGQHQRVVIECPSHCTFLRTSPPKKAFHSAMEKLLAYSHANVPANVEALDEMLGDDDAADWEIPFVSAYAAFGWQDPADEQTVLQKFLQDPPSNLRSDERDVLEALRDSVWFSVFHVDEVNTGEGLHIRDADSDDRFYVYDKLASEDAQVGDVIWASVLRFGERYEFTGALTTVPKGHQPCTLDALTETLDLIRHDEPGIPEREARLIAVPSVHRALRDSVLNWVPPHMVTTDGEDMVFCETIYDVDNRRTVLKKLRKHRDLDEAEPEYFVWLGPRKDLELGGAPIVLGSFVVETDTLNVITHSSERMERAKQLIADTLGDLVQHRTDTSEPVAEVMARWAKEDEEYDAEFEDYEEEDEGDFEHGYELDLSDPKARAEVQAFCQARINAWPDKPHSSLGNMTPRQLMKDPANADRVLEQLRIEKAAYAHEKLGHLVDFSGVFKELGLDEP